MSLQANQKYNSRKLSGTFISDWLVKTWNEQEWAREFSAMRDIGMEYLILAPSLLQQKSGTWYVNYPTKIDPACLQYDGIDIIEMLLCHAQRYGMKVFLGLNMHDRWWDNWWDSCTTLANGSWLQKQMQLGNTVAQELYDRYHSRYPQTFYGWYWVWEFWNSKEMSLGALGRNQSIDLFADCININLDFLSQLDSSMPLLFSPFANMQLSSFDDLYYMWEDIFKRIHFRSGDIFCPQDSVGAGGTKMSELRHCYAVYKRACDTAVGLRFWANNENFDHNDWSSASLDRFVKQLEITGELCEKNITFSYNNYYSPVNVGDGFYRAYQYYLLNGRLAPEKPSEPENITVSASTDGIIVRWKSSGDVAGYAVYKNQKRIGIVNCKRKDGADSIPKMNCQYTDSKGSVHDMYGVSAIGYEGNCSLVRYSGDIE